MAECAVTSSRHRAARAKQMQNPESEQQLLDYISDTTDEQYPIFRNSSPTDGAKTVATGNQNSNQI
jgi:hypothetical protein